MLASTLPFLHQAPPVCKAITVGTNVIMVKIEEVFVFLHINVSLASMVRGHITSVCAFSGSIEYITGQKGFWSYSLKLWQS